MTFRDKLAIVVTSALLMIILMACGAIITLGIVVAFQ